MVEPFCTIEWHGDGRQQIRMFDGAELSLEQRDAICREAAAASGDAESVDELKLRVGEVASRHGLRSQWLAGGHADPLDQVAAFTFWPLDG